MSERLLYSLVESPSHPVFSTLYESLGLTEKRFTTMRKAIAALKKMPPDIVVAEFFYGYGNNYAGVNVSNLDVFLHSLRKYAPQARVMVMVSRQEAGYVEKLQQLFSLDSVMIHPVTADEMKKNLDNL